MPSYFAGKIMTNPNAAKILLKEEGHYMQGAMRTAKQVALFQSRLILAGIHESDQQYFDPVPKQPVIEDDTAPTIRNAETQ